MGSMKDEMIKVAAELSEPSTEPKVEPKTEPKLETKSEPKVEPKIEPKTEAEKPLEAKTPVESDDPLPEGWADDRKESWRTLSPDLRKYLKDREKQRNDGLNSKMLEADKVKKQYERYEPVSKVFEPIRQQLELNGVSEAQYVQRLIAAENFLRTQPKDALKWLAQNAGVKLEDLVATEAYKDPELEKRDQRIAELERRFQNQDVTSTQAVQTQVKTAIESFQAEKDTSGAPKYPHFEKVRVAMGALMQSGQAKDLQDAYDRAVMVDPEIRESIFAERLKQHEAKLETERAAKAKEAKAAGLNIKGSTPIEVTANEPKGWKAALKQAEQQLS